ncbi:MAG: hypothetical protein QOF53_4048 [Nocardioidaceae bacterium]|nr:hypothetical protein [Nocardioidaceae bacterium]
MVVETVEASGVEETLDAVDRLYETRVEAEARTFELAAHFADLHSGDSLRKRPAGTPAGRERAVPLGGEGTPRVAEFAVAELGGRMRTGTWAARHYIADALDVRHRLPSIWERVRSRECRVGNARLVAARTRHLTADAAAYVDRAMVDFVDGSLPWGRFETRLMGKVVAADPETAAMREAARVKEQFAKRTRSSEDGTAGFYVRSTVGVIARLDATVEFVADALKAFGDTEDRDLRRVKAILILCNPAKAVELLAAFAAMRSRTLPADGDVPESPTAGEATDAPDHHDAEPDVGPDDALARMDAFARRVGFTPCRLPAWLAARTSTEDVPEFVFDWSKLLPPVTLNLHICAEAADDAPGQAVVRWDGVGPVTESFVREHLRPVHSFVIQPVIDLANMAPVDAYEIPDRHRKAVLLRTPADCFPFSSALPDPTTPVDIDHSEAHHPAPTGTGEEAFMSRLDNYGPLGRFHHRVKTHGRWLLRQPFAGIYLWRDPHGQVFLVDHSGTHKVTAPGAAAGVATASNLELEIHPADVVIEVDFGRGL